MPFFFYLSDLHETEVWYQWNHGGSDFRNFESPKSKFLGNFDPFWLKNLKFLIIFTGLTRNGAIFFWVVPGTCEAWNRVRLSPVIISNTYHIPLWCIWVDVENPELWEISTVLKYWLGLPLRIPLPLVSIFRENLKKNMDSPDRSTVILEWQFY